MRMDTFYEEKMLSTPVVVILGVVSFVLLFFAIQRLSTGPETGPLLTWLFLILGLVMLGLAIDLSRLTIRMDPGSLSVGYGIMRSLLRWEDVEGCEED